ncbi:MAG: hypothetical protein IPJ43_12255 [Saprospiraceae bacterium]|nr:hypothetical protein [Saprospiraceae bacterium]
MTQIRNVMPEKNYPSYSAEWEKINQLQSQGLIKDVINQVELLLARAERENNLPQQYKCIMTLEAQLIRSDEEGVKGFITRIEKKKERQKNLLNHCFHQFWDLPIKQYIPKAFMAALDQILLQ